MQIRRPHHRLWCSTFVLKVSRMRIFARRGFDASTSARAQHEERAKGACIKTPPRGVSRSPRRHREARSSPRGHPSLFSPTTRRHFASHALVEQYCSTSQTKSVWRDGCAIVCDDGPDSRDVRRHSDSRRRLLTDSRRHFALQSRRRERLHELTNARRLSFDSGIHSLDSYWFQTSHFLAPACDVVARVTRRLAASIHVCTV